MESIKGWDWMELADVWGITVDKTISYIKKCEDGNCQFVTEPWSGGLDEKHPAGIVKTETYMKEFVNGDFVVRLTDEEDILAEKIKDFLFDNLNEDNLKLPKDIKEDLVTFLTKLSEGTQHGSAEIIGTIAKAPDFTLVHWVCRNLEALWG